MKPLKPAGKAAIPLPQADPGSGWLDLSNMDPAQIPQLAVYRVRLVDQNGFPVPIARLLDVDSCGLLYIGRTHSTSNFRIADLIEDLANPSPNPKHGIGKKLWRARFLDRIQKHGHQCQVGWDELSSYQMLGGDEAADVIRERDLLTVYFTQHAELPPFNRALPEFLK